MAELRNGPLGFISGKVGNVIAGNWRDISYLRGLSKRSTKEPTEQQLIARMKFSLALAFLAPIKEVVDLGFKNQYTGRMTAFNHSVKMNIEAVKGTFPDLLIDPAKIVLSTGNLMRCADVVMDPTGPGIVTVSWGDLGQVKAQLATDIPTVVLYNPAKEVHATYSGTARRGDYSMELEIPQSFSGDEVHGYIFFTTATGDKNSKSVYLNPITLA